MKNIVIMDIDRIKNDRWAGQMASIGHFTSDFMSNTVCPRRLVEMSDVFIVTDKYDFKILKCRVPEMPNEQVLPLAFLDHTLKLINEWQES